MTKINPIQQIHLDLIKHANFNTFEGQPIADMLIQHAELWGGAIASHSYRTHPAYRLFDELPENEWSPDTLWLMAVNDDAAQQLKNLCLQLYAEDVEIYAARSHPSIAEIRLIESQDAELDGIELTDSRVLVRAWWD